MKRILIESGRIEIKQIGFPLGEKTSGEKVLSKNKEKEEMVGSIANKTYEIVKTILNMRS